MPLRTENTQALLGQRAFQTRAGLAPRGFSLCGVPGGFAVRNVCARPRAEGVEALGGTIVRFVPGFPSAPSQGAVNQFGVCVLREEPPVAPEL